MAKPHRCQPQPSEASGLGVSPRPRRVSAASASHANTSGDGIRATDETMPTRRNANLFSGILASHPLYAPAPRVKEEGPRESRSERGEEPTRHPRRRDPSSKSSAAPHHITSRHHAAIA
ncbi:hypothetical protein IMZ48_49080 [Candidatus Bathyarchaeota archaeon]|nr:hypothetical protein [Candidatus Bathyarchaeota archaeon]